MINKPPHKVRKIILVTLIVILLAVAAIAVWFYQSPFNEQKIKAFQDFPLPVAVVDGNIISSQDFVQRYQLAKDLGQNVTNQQILNELIQENQTQTLAHKYDVVVTQNQLDDYYNQQVANNGDQILSTTHLSQDQYKQQILKPQLLLINLKIWFNSQASLNPQVYAQANSLIQSIKSGQDMKTLAKNNSQEDLDQLSNGDLGYVDITSLQPELRDPVSSMKIGDVNLIPSREGLHIVKLEGKSGNQVHLRQIFLYSNDFSAWYNQQLQSFKIWRFGV